MGSLHARVISEHDGCELTWVADPASDAAELLTDRYGGTPIGTPDYSGVDGVVVASPTETHAAVAAEVIAARRPLLLEKPVAGSLQETIEVVRASETAGVPLMCGLLERFNPAVRTAFSIAAEPVQMLSVRHSPYAERIRTGVAWDLAIHDVDLALRLFGEPAARVCAVVGQVHPSSDPGSEDTIGVMFSTAAGQTADISASRISQRKIRTLTIVELDRLIEVDLIRRDITIHRHLGHELAEVDGLGYRQQSIIEVPVVRFVGEPLALQLSHFLGLVAGTVDADEERSTILPAHEVIDQALRSVSV